MIADLDAHRGELPEYDLCVVGSGPAGGTLAAELAKSGLAVCVLESGRARPTAYGDALREVDSEGIFVKDYSRERVLGGASTTWAGLSSPMDRQDLLERPYLRSSGWPVSPEALDPYYAAASERYRFPPLPLFGPEGFGALRERGDLEPEWSGLEEKVFLAAAEPQDFGREVRGVYERDEADLWLDATVLRLEAESGTRRVARAVLRTRSGREATLRARSFVVAAGGIENARLLLQSTDLCPAGLGNERDQVGRWLMNHPKNYFGTVRLERPVTDLSYYFGCLYRGFAGYAGLRLPLEVQRREGLLNSYVRFEPLFPWSDSEGIEALVTIVKRTKFLLAPFRRKSESEVVDLRDYAETGDDSDLQNRRKGLGDWLRLLGPVLADAPKIARYLWYRLASRSAPRVRRMRIRNFMEMEPNPDNRVVLGERRDVHGSRLPLVRHRLTELDRRSLVALHEVLAEELPRRGFGPLEGRLGEAEPWPIDQDASHHMGTTRMGLDPETSVVDPDLRVHGVENLWMAGASVFPTSGCANPTFTIVALSIRLAEHLRSALVPREVPA